MFRIPDFKDGIRVAHSVAGPWYLPSLLQDTDINVLH
jgi:hypothetical protein